MRDQSEIYSLNPAQDARDQGLIDAKGKEGDTLGGVLEVRVEGLPFGLGTHAQWDRKLDGRLAQAVMAVQAIKGVEIGLGFEAARRSGSQVHDPIHYDESPTRHAQPGLHAADEQRRRAGSRHDQWPAAGHSGGEKADQHAAQAARFDQPGKQATRGGQLRTQRRLAVPAASVILENVVAFEIAAALVEKFGGDSLVEMQARWKLFHEMARGR